VAAPHRESLQPIQPLDALVVHVLAVAAEASVGGVCRAGAEVGEDLVDHRRLRNEGDDAHRAVAGGTGERVDLENLLQEDRPSASGFGGRESCGGDDQGWRIGCCGQMRFGAVRLLR